MVTLSVKLIQQLRYKLALAVGMIMAYRFLFSWIWISRRQPAIVIPFTIIGFGIYQNGLNLFHIGCFQILKASDCLD